MSDQEMDQRVRAVLDWWFSVRPTNPLKAAIDAICRLALPLDLLLVELRRCWRELYQPNLTMAYRRLQDIECEFLKGPRAPRPGGFRRIGDYSSQGFFGGAGGGVASAA